MADNEDVLRRSLDAVDRHRLRLLVGLAVGVAVLFLAFYHGSRAADSGTMVFMHAMFVITIVWTTLLALVVVIQMTVMTKRILRAIELASKRS
jgi:hypothetical protein